MGYTKVVRSGNLLEIYEFSKERRSNETFIKRSKRNAVPVRRNPGRRVDNLKRSAKLFRRIVRANLGGNESVVFLTLTMHSVVSRKASGIAYTQFIQRLAREHGRHIRCFGVPEKQKRGAWHFHALVIGLNEEETKKERTTRNIARLWGYGTCDAVITDGSIKLAAYLTKYMSKQMPVEGSDRANRVSEFVEAQGSGKAYFVTRNVMRPLSAGSNSFDIAKDLIVPVEKSPLHERVYSTKWLGTCNYKSYLIPTIYGQDRDAGEGARDESRNV